MKVSVAQVVNRHTAGAEDLFSLLAGDKNTTFASLLHLGASEHPAGNWGDISRGKQGERPSKKDTDEGGPSISEGSNSNGAVGPLVMQTFPVVVATQWQFEARECGARGDAEGKPSSALVEQKSSERSAGGLSTLENGARIVNPYVSNPQRVLNRNPEVVAPLPVMKGDERVEPLRSTADEDPGARVMEVFASPHVRAAGSAVEQTPAAIPVLQGSTQLPGNEMSVVIPEPIANDEPVGVSAIRRDVTASNHAVTNGENQNPGISVASRWSGLSELSARGEASSSVPVQGCADAAFHSSTDNSSQGGGGDAHHGSPSAKGTFADSHVSTKQALQGDDLGPLYSGGSTHGHSAPLSAAHSGSVRNDTPAAQIKEQPLLRNAEAGAARLLGSAIRSDLRVGVQTEAFGKVTIQTNAQGGQLTAQLSLENAKEGAALAAHFPGLEQKIIQQHGLTASVRLAGGLDGGAGSGSMGRDQTASDRRQPERNRDDVGRQLIRFERNPSAEVGAEGSAFLERRYSATSRLDVTV